MKRLLICLAFTLSFSAMAMETNTSWQSEIIHSQALLSVLIDSNYGVELRYNSGTPTYSRLGEIENFQTERYYSIKSNLILKNSGNTNIKIYQIKNTNLEIVEDLNLNYLKVLDLNNANQVVYVQKIYKTLN